MQKLLSAAALAVTLAGCSDNGGTTPSSIDSESGTILRTLEGQGLAVHGQLDVPGGLTAFAASAGTQALAIYIMPDSNYALIGTLIDAEGNPVGEEELLQLVSEPMEESAWASLEAASWVQDGNPDAERIVYTFTDANCPFCNELWNAARPWVEAGKVQLRHVMVGVIRANSAAKAAAILGADDPQAALTHNELNHGDGGIDPIETISEEMNARLTSNVALMRDLGFSGTPGLVARGADGALSFQRGVPRGPILEELFGPL